MLIKIGKSSKRQDVNKKYVREVLGTERGATTFGFVCDLEIQAHLRQAANKMQVPLYGLSEEIFETSLEVINTLTNDPEQFQLLKDHIVEYHIAKRTIDKIGKFNAEMAEILKEEYQAKLTMEKTVKRIVERYIEYGQFKPSQVQRLLEFGFACMEAERRGRIKPNFYPLGFNPFPKDMSVGEKVRDNSQDNTGQENK
jgi:hypothetical protein